MRIVARQSYKYKKIRVPLPKNRRVSNDADADAGTDAIGCVTRRVCHLELCKPWLYR